MERPLSQKYKDNLKPITIPGVSGYVWDRDLLCQFLKSDESNHYAILGGDVLRIVGDKMEYTYDSWSVSDERQASETFPNFVARCKEQAVKYILHYPIKNNVVFSLVMSSEYTAGFYV